MKQTSLMRHCFSGLAYVLFDRRRSFAFCSLFSAASLLVELKLHIETIFSCSGAIITLAGLFLNIKHSLHFHLSLPKENIFYMLAGMGPMGNTMTGDNEIWVDSVLADEMAGVSFMVIGTLVWAYGGFIVKAIS